MLRIEGKFFLGDPTHTLAPGHVPVRQEWAASVYGVDHEHQQIVAGSDVGVYTAMPEIPSSAANRRTVTASRPSVFATEIATSTACEVVTFARGPRVPPFGARG